MRRSSHSRTVRLGAPPACVLSPADYIPTIGPRSFFHSAEQPGKDLSQVSAKAGNETEPIASRTSLRSPSETGTSVMPYFLTVVHGSLPTLQRTASSNRSFEYVQISSSSCLNAVSSLACCSGVNFFHVLRLMP